MDNQERERIAAEAEKLNLPETAKAWRDSQTPRPNDAVRRLRDRISLRLNNHLCEMKEGYDDSIVGFNEAWDIVRAAFDEALNDHQSSEG